MTVEQLIERLKELDPKSEVLISTNKIFGGDTAHVDFVMTPQELYEQADLSGEQPPETKEEFTELLSGTVILYGIH